jgi:uncharacterized protein
LDFFIDIVEIINEFKKPDQQISLAIQTNGTLLDEKWASFFKENNVLVGLSVDGPKEIHDTHRLGRKKQDTHAIVAKNMKMLKDNEVAFNTLTVITKANVERGTELVKYFLEKGSSYMQFIPCVESIDGKIADYSPTPGQYAKFLIEVFDLWLGDGQPNFYVRLFDEMLITFVEYVPASCYFAPTCIANLVIEHDGTVFPCDFFVEDEWKLGNINDKSFDEISNDPLLTKFIERKRILDTKCESCEYKSLCFGDCPKYRLSLDGDKIDIAYFCEAYKEFFEYAMPKFKEIKRALHNDASPPKFSYWKQLENSLERNSPCPCGSGKKFKKCCLPVKGI